MNPMQGPTISTPSPPAQQRPLRSSRGWTGQATVEFAIVSILFLMIVLGTLDFGRAIYMDSQLTNAVREGARYGQVAPTDTAGIQNRVIKQATGLGLTAGNITATCSTSCTTGSDITVKANLKFKFIAQRFLRLGPLTMHAQATDAID